MGVYDIEESEDKRVFTVTDGQLYSQRAGGQLYQIIPYEKDKFYYETRTTVAFDRDDAGSQKAYYLVSSEGLVDGRPHRFDRLLRRHALDVGRRYEVIDVRR